MLDMGKFLLARTVWTLRPFLPKRNAKSFGFSGFWRERLEPGLFMDTRSRHGQVTEMRGDMYALKKNWIETPCPRQRFFVEARKRDDGDHSAGARGTERSPA